MGIATIELNVNLDDDSFDKNDPSNFVLVRGVV